tara:strand:+ start:69672 stop:71711 length:2040 start_codon:yes stop_codon:yes gene_type:complete
MITATGIGSGLDIESLVNQLVSAERTPAETRLLRQEATLTSELSGFGLLKSSLAAFQSSLADLTRQSTFGQRTATSSNTDIIAVSARTSAAASSYDLSVTQLAKSHSLASGSFASASDDLGTGTLTIRFGTTDYTPADPGPQSYNQFTVNPDRGIATIDINSSNNTLEGVRDAINQAGIGVSAAIVNDGSGYRLLMSSQDTGAANSLEISVSDTGDGNDSDTAGLSVLAFNAAATNMSQTSAAQDALFSVNGLAISSSDNTAKNVINGVDITLKDVTGAAPVTVSIAENRAGVSQVIGKFVNAYNSFVGTANNLTAYDPETGNAGALQGDFSARSITGQLRQTLVNAVEGLSGAYTSLSAIGISTQSDGTLAIDTARLDKALETNFDQMSGLFSAVGFPSDNGVTFISSTANTAVASHAVNITQLASVGVYTGNAANFPLTINDDNDNITVKIDGVSSENISLTQGSYANGSELAAEIQARINGDAELSAAGLTVNVSFSGGQLAISSNQYGSASKVEVSAIDTNTASDLGLSVAAGIAGVDIAGTIGGVAAIGSGQLLTGANGSAAEGLRLLIESGTIGDRGAVEFSQGVAYKLDNMLKSFLDNEGILGARTLGIQGRIDDISDSREILERRMETLEIRYRNQFNTLDTLLSQLQSTSDFLTQQLSALPEAGTLLNGN